MIHKIQHVFKTGETDGRDGCVNNVIDCFSQMLFEEKQDEEEGKEFEKFFHQAHGKKAVEKVVHPVLAEGKGVGELQADGLCKKSGQDAHQENEQQHAFPFVLKDIDAPEILDPNESQEQAEYNT
jgi:hypothetical protein